MSGEGLICARRPMPADCGAEVLADVIAYLQQRCANAALVAKRMAEFEPLASDRARQLEVIIGDLKAGLHEGSAVVLAALQGEV